MEEHKIKLSTEKVIDIVRMVRNEIISDLLNDHQSLKSFYEKFTNKELTRTKLAFIKRELNELLNSPLNLTHYATLLNKIRETNSTGPIQQHKQNIFYKEIEIIVNKYLH